MPCWPRPAGRTCFSTTSRSSTTPGIASYTGVSNASILENLKLLGREHGNIWVRVPIVPGLNDADGDLEATVRFAASVPGVKQVNLLTYHHTGAYKFSRLGKPYLAESVTPPAPEFFGQAAARLQGLGVPIVVRRLRIMTPRTARLRQESLDAQPSLTAERASLLTDFYQANEGKYSVPVMRARSFHYLCRHKTIYLGDGELIVGERARDPRSCPPTPS